MELEEKEEEEAEDQKFTYQNPIPENPDIKTSNFQIQQNQNPEVKTPNIQLLPNQNNQNPNIINQYLLLIIVINPPPASPNTEQQQQPQLLPQQQIQHKEDDAQVWLNDVEKAITANRWNNDRALQSLAIKLQPFQEFKTAFLEYFSNNNSINCLVNIFTTIKQGETKAVTTYLGHFHRNLHQIQAIQADYFTVPQILNQFIHGLCITNVKDFESAELEANHVQAVNLVMNESSELDSKLKQFRITNCPQNQPHLSLLSNQLWQQEMHICHYCVSNSELPIQFSTILTDLSVNDAIANISTTHISTSSLLTAATNNISTTTATNNLSDTHSSNTAIKPSSNDIKKP
ncbi:hypothetical protein G9A89_006975 [Geosiphon pyriformis]|nr:hypothetical protein G9A89_006975 [Geosiphon pyriformis]